jgi:hypothetical protein
MAPWAALLSCESSSLAGCHPPARPSNLACQSPSWALPGWVSEKDDWLKAERTACSGGNPATVRKGGMEGGEAQRQASPGLDGSPRS